MDAARKTSSSAVGSFGASARIGRTAPARASVLMFTFRPVPADRLARQIPARRPGMFYICSVKPTARSSLSAPFPSPVEPGVPPCARPAGPAGRRGNGARPVFLRWARRPQVLEKSNFARGNTEETKCPESAFPPSGAEARGAAAEGGGQSQSARLGADQRKDRRSEPALRDPPPSTPARRGGEGDDDRIGRDARPGKLRARPGNMESAPGTETTLEAPGPCLGTVVEAPQPAALA